MQAEQEEGLYCPVLCYAKGMDVMTLEIYGMDVIPQAIRYGCYTATGKHVEDDTHNASGNEVNYI